MSRENSVTLQIATQNKEYRRSSIWLFLAVFLTFSLTLVSQSMAKTTELKMVVLGDSLTAGYGLGPGEGFPEQLQILADEADMPLTIENAGVSGDTTSGGLARLNWSVGEGVDIVLIELGANDALRGLSPKVTLKNLDEMISQLRSRDIHVMLAGMLAPPNMGADYEKEFNAIYPNLAEKYQIPLYPFFLDGVAAEPELNQADGIHPTAEGIKIIARKFLNFFNDNLTIATAQ